MSVIIGCEEYACPKCQQAVHATKYGSLNSWSAPGDAFERGDVMFNAGFAQEPRHLRCRCGNEFASGDAEMLIGHDYPSLRGRRGQLSRAVQRLRLWVNRS